LNEVSDICHNIYNLKSQIFSNGFNVQDLNVDIEKLLNSRSLFNALKQTYARKYKIPLSNVSISLYDSFNSMKMRINKL